jgi:hypothetical protein
MNKSQLIAVMSMMTIAGIAIVAAGLFSVAQMPDFTLSQAWNDLWSQHQAFASVMAIYCAVMMTFDLWVIAGIITQASAQKDVVMSPSITSSSKQE